MPTKKRKRQKRQEWQFNDFRAILDLPERLAKYLRELLHLEKSTWDFCLDKIRQYKVWQEEKKSNKDLKPLAPETRLYKEWSKSKGRGKGRRYFAAPCPELKVVQEKVLYRFLAQCRVHFCRYGGQKKESTLTNARRHLGFADNLFEVDIINAFPTVFRSRVFANFKKPFGHALREFRGVEFSADDTAAMLNALCDLVCLHDRLPQGPPTSPRILDIVCRKMDTQLYELLEANSTPFQSYRYTTYADNLFVSSNGPMPEEMRERILVVIKENGFIPHTRSDKTKYYSPESGEHPAMMGLVLNNTDHRITMAPGKVNQFRARLHHHLQLKTWDKEVMGKVNGDLGYIRQVYPIKVPSKLKEVVSQCEERLARTKRGIVLGSDVASGGTKTSRKKVVKKRAAAAQASTSAKKTVKKATTKSKTKTRRTKDAVASSDNGRVHDARVPVSNNGNGNGHAAAALHAVLFSDGGSRNNPGLAGIGFVLDITGRDPVRHSEVIGMATNNQAEYLALFQGLARARREGVTHIDCRLDSELVVDQLAGDCQIKNDRLRVLAAKVNDLIQQFDEVTLERIPREENTTADELVNRAMDAAV